MSKNGTKAVKKTRFVSGVTLVEVMVCIAVLLVAILGTSTYQFTSAMHARKANLQATAARVALMMGEAWDGVFGLPAFNPISEFDEQLSIVNSLGPDRPDGFDPVGSYKITIEHNDYYTTLSYKNLDASQGMRVLSVIVNWDQCGKGMDSFEGTDKSYILTIYVENPVKI